jgi:glycosyltransferase involved in cell wall biosynthesis
MERLARAHGIVPAVIPVGVDTAWFAPGDDRPGPPWRLLHVANLNAVKDQATLLDALRLARRRIPDTHLDIVGLDTLGGAIQEAARALHLGDHVTFHGVQRTDAVAAFCRRAHLHVMSSRHEAAGVAVLEAAACGVPTAGTTVGYVSDWAPDRAVAVPVGDAPALADAIVAMLLDPERRRRIGHAAQQWVLAHDADWTAAQFDHLYETLAAP